VIFISGLLFWQVSIVHNMDVHSKWRLQVLVNLLIGVWPQLLLDIVVVIMHTCPRAIPLAIFTNRKTIILWVSMRIGFDLVPLWVLDGAPRQKIEANRIYFRMGAWKQTEVQKAGWECPIRELPLNITLAHDIKHILEYSLWYLHPLQGLGRQNKQMSLWSMALKCYGPFITSLGH